ncbi:RNA polymerase sigma factor [Kordiimonas aestuarii]|uniref:RNA polymerase sigma factor n=1 Tax=Kordiimonas aestuarii TaxID=1005925 RepID=UPI0021CE7980|nr:RNA polymerase sigma factor [Kordiimonas aestuarii]
MTDTRAEEDLLVLEAKGGCRQAFAGLFKRYNLPLTRFAYRLSGDSGLAHDAVQEAWVSLARNLRTMEDPRAFRVWIYRAVRWRLVDLVRRRGDIPASLDDANLETGSGEPELATNDQLNYHMALLGAGDRVVLTLFYLEDMKLSEMAAVLEVPIGTVKSRLHRARAQLRQQMTGDNNEQP